MPRNFELEAQLATLELKVDIARAVQEVKAIRRTQAQTPKAGVQTDEQQIQKRRAKEISRTRSQRHSREPLED
jgi:hypothetical protein